MCLLCLSIKGVYAKSKRYLIQPTHPPDKKTTDCEKTWKKTCLSYLSIHACNTNRRKCICYPIITVKKKQRMQVSVFSFPCLSLSLSLPNVRTLSCKLFYRLEVAFTICLLLFNQLFGASCRRCSITWLLCNRLVRSYQAVEMSAFSRVRFLIVDSCAAL